MALAKGKLRKYTPAFYRFLDSLIYFPILITVLAKARCSLHLCIPWCVLIVTIHIKVCIQKTFQEYDPKSAEIKQQFLFLSKLFELVQIRTKVMRAVSLSEAT